MSCVVRDLFLIQSMLPIPCGADACWLNLQLIYKPTPRGWIVKYMLICSISIIITMSDTSDRLYDVGPRGELWVWGSQQLRSVAYYTIWYYPSSPLLSCPALRQTFWRLFLLSLSNCDAHPQLEGHWEGDKKNWKKIIQENFLMRGYFPTLFLNCKLLPVTERFLEIKYTF